MNYLDESQSILLKKYETTIDDYYEFLLQEDMRQIPQRKKNALSRYLFQISVLIIISLVLLFLPEVEKGVFLIFLGVALFMTGAFLVSYFYFNNEAKNIQALHRSVNKKEWTTEETIFNLLPNGIIFTLPKEKWVIKAGDMEEIYETENLLVILIKGDKEISVKDAEKLLIPKRAMTGDEINLVKDTVTKMMLENLKKVANN